MEDTVIRNLDKFINHDFKLKLEDALEKSCLLVEASAKENLSHLHGDGQLRQSIKHKVDSAEMTGVVGTNVEYAPYVEIGTGIYSSKGTGRKTAWVYRSEDGKFHRTVGMKPTPFLEDAMEQNRGKIAKCFEGIV